jgi:uncharacterized protein
MGFRQEHRIVDLGIGVGARPKHNPEQHEARQPSIDWCEVISENFMVDGGRPLANLDRLRASYRVVPHGVSLSIGAARPLDRDYLTKLKAVVDRIDPPWFTDHLCWTGAFGVDIHDLLPVPFTRDVITYVAERIRRVQDFIGRPFGIENASSYMTFTADAMPEWEFLGELTEKADCGILLDCNNVYVSSRNHGFDAEKYIDAVPADRVIQMHLAGHTDKGTYLLDTHSDHVKDDVWDLYRRAIRRTGPVSTLIEWDEDIPEWSVLEAEAVLARKVRSEALGVVARTGAASVDARMSRRDP